MLLLKWSTKPQIKWMLPSPHVTLLITVQFILHYNAGRVWAFVFPFSASYVLISDPSANMSGPNHLASDSDSEVYCDSVDQFGQEEVSNNVRKTHKCGLCLVNASMIDSF